jgi:hypothetical protein
MADYPRDLIGYGATPPHAQWLDGAQIAVQFVMVEYVGCVIADKSL